MDTSAQLRIDIALSEDANVDGAGSHIEAATVAGPARDIARRVRIGVSVTCAFDLVEHLSRRGRESARRYVRRIQMMPARQAFRSPLTAFALAGMMLSEWE
jgi:hypothetical protein